MIERLSRHTALRQLIKFCIVGSSSTVVDKGVLWMLLTRLPLVPWWISQSFSFCAGVTNGFIWNRAWTFREQSQVSARKQYPVFVATNIIGLLLNLVIAKGVLVLLTGQVSHTSNPDPKHTMIASLSAIPIVTVWNFTAAKCFAFRAAPSATTSSSAS